MKQGHSLAGMEASDLLAAGKRALLEAASDLAGALVYADAGAGELLQVPQRPLTAAA